MRRLLLIALILLTGCSTVVPVKQKFPEVPKELMESCPELQTISETDKLSEVLKVVTNNYAQYQECRVKVDTWVDWYNSQREIYNK